MSVRTSRNICLAGCSAFLLVACGGGGQPAITSTVTVSATPSVRVSTTTAATTTKAATDSSAEVSRVIANRGEIICLMFELQGMNQETLDEVGKYVVTTPAFKLSKQQAIQVIQGSVETYCPAFSRPIAEVFG